MADESLFMDEIRQASYYEFDFSTIVKAAATQNQPPLDYWIGHIVALMSDSDFAVRLPAAVFGAGSVLLLTFMVASFASMRVALIVGTILALLPFHIYYSQEARPYAIPVFLLLMLLYLVHYLIRTASPRVPWYFALWLIATLFAFSRADFPLVLLSVLLVIVVLRAMWGGLRADGSDPRRLLGIAAALAGGVALYLPLLFYLLSVGARYAPGSEALGSVEWIVTGWQRISFGPVWQAWWAQTEPLGFLLIPMAVAGGIAALVSSTMRREPLVILAVLLVLLAAPAHLFTFFASTSLPLRPPYLIYLLPLGLVLAAVPVHLMLEKLSDRRANVVVAGTIVVLVVPLAVSIAGFKATPKRTDWRGLAGYIERSTDNTNVLLADSLVAPGTWEPNLYGFKRYPYGDALYGGPLRELWRHLDNIGTSTLSPVLVVFQYHPYLLTPSSDYPVMRSLHERPLPLADELSGTMLETADFTSLTAVRLERPSGSLADDLQSMLEILTSRLPARPAMLDLFVARAIVERVCGSAQYQELLDEAEELADGTEAADIDALREILGDYRPKKTC